MAAIGGGPTDVPVVPGYHLGERIGAGGTAVVYRAERDSDGCPLAIKLWPAGVESAEPLVGYQRHAAVLLSLKHPNLLTLHEIGRTDGFRFVVMDWIDGGDLRSRMVRHCPLDVPRVVELVDAIAAGLDYLHQRNLLHLDLKPENVLLSTAGRIVVADFSLAALRSATRRYRPLVELRGTDAYAAPEQRHGLSVDERSDLFSLATICYELLCGSLPGRAFVPCSDRNPRLPRAVDDVLLRALARRSQDRYSVVAEFRHALASCLTGKP